ncbi:MAG: hypothetical protein KGQ36_04100 [Rickettsiales bacterium]|nr:hypothetical protein [Rickettsiales bacterium]
MADKKFEDSLLNKLNSPSFSPQSISDIENLELITKIFQQVEEETAQVAEMLFEYLIEASDSEIMTGTIPSHKNAKIDKYIQILNRLFKFSRAGSKQGSFRVINRKTIKELDKKTYAISMCHDGGTSLDILCDVVNSENSARTPSNSVKVVVIKQLSPAAIEKNSHEKK